MGRLLFYLLDEAVGRFLVAVVLEKGMCVGSFEAAV